jgi:hypothetical protein
MVGSPYVDFRAGELLEPVLQAEFRHVLDAAGIEEPLTGSVSGHQLTIGDPEGIRTLDLHRDRVAC